MTTHLLFISHNTLFVFITVGTKCVLGANRDVCDPRAG